MLKAIDYNIAPNNAEKNELDRNSLYNVLNRKSRSIYGKHFLWYDDYMIMVKEELSSYWSWVFEKKGIQ